MVSSKTVSPRIGGVVPFFTIVGSTVATERIVILAVTVDYRVCSPTTSWPIVVVPGGNCVGVGKVIQSVCLGGHNNNPARIKPKLQ